MTGGHLKIFKQATGTKKKRKFPRAEMSKRKPGKYSMFDVP